MTDDLSRRDRHALGDPDPTENWSEDGVARRDFLKCMAWAGSGLVWTVAGGILSSRSLAQAASGDAAPGDFSFAQGEQRRDRHDAAGDREDQCAAG